MIAVVRPLLRLSGPLSLLFAVATGCGAVTDEARGSESAGIGGRLIGNPAPEFHAKNVGSPKEMVSLRPLRGKVVLLDFWGTFCEPCKKSFPKLERLRSTFADRGLVVVGISEDEPEDRDKISAFGDTYGAKFTLAWDADRSAARAFKPETMPSSFLVDRNGIVRFAHAGYHDGEEKELEKEIRGLLEP
jgi:cytochrome c biogenesis protein CcmG/thiol:disulfide interchange protein DsbE